MHRDYIWSRSYIRVGLWYNNWYGTSTSAVELSSPSSQSTKVYPCRFACTDMSFLWVRGRIAGPQTRSLLQWLINRPFYSMLPSCTFISENRTQLCPCRSWWYNTVNSKRLWYLYIYDRFTTRKYFVHGTINTWLIRMRRKFKYGRFRPNANHVLWVRKFASLLTACEAYRWKRIYYGDSSRQCEGLFWIGTLFFFFFVSIR